MKDRLKFYKKDLKQINLHKTTMTNYNRNRLYLSSIGNSHSIQEIKLRTRFRKLTYDKKILEKILFFKLN